jgi:hypothetical protein
VGRADHFSDVCGAIDELKRSLVEEPEASAASSERLVGLVESALEMQSRMEARLAEYEEFREEVGRLHAALVGIPGSRRADALNAAPDLLHLLTLGRPLTESERVAATVRAEEIRSAAADLERSLYRYKDVALALARAYRAIKGGRTWVLDEAEAREVANGAGEPDWSHWLPPSPHRERILRYLRAGRAHLVEQSEGADSPPVVQFEDGGLMPLPSVRWSEEVRNFHLVDSPPHPHGLRYRE